MIHNDEIRSKAQEFGIHTSNVQRDYIFGWLLSGVNATDSLSDQLVLKGGNAFRKAYFATTRFSDDLDFTTPAILDRDLLIQQFNLVCERTADLTGIKFDIDRNQVVDEELITQDRKIYKLRLYFRDFSGNADHIVLKVRVDVTEHDRIFLPVQARNLIHPYSDIDQCASPIRVVQLEEALADKLKCLMQRRYSHDLFDLAHGIFIEPRLEVDRGLVVSTFLRKTIFEPSPEIARSVLVELPLEGMRRFWDRMVCPVASRMSFDSAVSLVRNGINLLFQPFASGHGYEYAYFPSHLRNPILTAGEEMTLLQVTYDGITRLVEPYSLKFKWAKRSGAREYLYVWDLTGGHGGTTGIKAFVQENVQAISNTSTSFMPRFEVEIAKAGDRASPDYPATPFMSTRGVHRRRRVHSREFSVTCPYCDRTFSRSTVSLRLSEHQDGYGNRCPGRIGYRS